MTGCTGLLGSWLARHLVSAGASVVGLVRDWVPETELFRSGTLDKLVVIRGDVREQAVLERALGEYEVKTVFHLAAQTIVGIASRNPVSTFETNIQGTWAVLEACRRSGVVEEIVVASSDKAYGSHRQLPYSEEAPLEGRYPYDVSKACADLITQSYAVTFGLPVVVTRCGNLYGGGDLNWNRLVPGTVRSALAGQRPIIRSDGTLIRDYFYVEDAALAYATLAERMAVDRSLAGQAFNFSAEAPLSVLEMTRRVLAAAGREDLDPDVKGTATGEIAEQYLSSEKARSRLRWAPVLSQEEGLRRTVAWYRRYFADLDGRRAP